MNIQYPAPPTGHPNAPPPRSTRSYVGDAVAMAIYVVAIAGSAMFLDVPYPWIVAAAIAFVTLVFFNPTATAPLGQRPRPRAKP